MKTVCSSGKTMHEITLLTCEKSSSDNSLLIKTLTSLCPPVLNRYVIHADKSPSVPGVKKSAWITGAPTPSSIDSLPWNLPSETPRLFRPGGVLLCHSKSTKVSFWRADSKQEGEKEYLLSMGIDVYYVSNGCMLLSMSCANLYRTHLSRC